MFGFEVNFSEETKPTVKTWSSMFLFSPHNIKRCDRGLHQYLFSVTKKEDVIVTLKKKRLKKQKAESSESCWIYPLITLPSQDLLVVFWGFVSQITHQVTKSFLTAFICRNQSKLRKKQTWHVITFNMLTLGPKDLAFTFEQHPQFHNDATATCRLQRFHV